VAKFRVVHYLNQFFGQIGGEEKADTAPLKKDGPVGPGTALNGAFKGEAEVVGTVICGDSYFAENMEEALKQILSMIQEYNPDLVVAGPAFNAGRYGTACGAVAEAVVKNLGIPAVTGMYPENPGVEMYKKSVYIIATADSAIEALKERRNRHSRAGRLHCPGNSEKLLCGRKRSQAGSRHAYRQNQGRKFYYRTSYACF